MFCKTAGICVFSAPLRREKDCFYADTAFQPRAIFSLPAFIGAYTEQTDRIRSPIKNKPHFIIALHTNIFFIFSDRLSARRRYGYYTRFFSFRQQKRTPNTKIRFRFRRSFAFSAYFALFSFIKETISARSRVFSVAFLSASAAASAAAFAACSSARRFCSAASARSAS